MNQILNMLVRMMANRAMSWGLRKGAGRMVGTRGATPRQPSSQGPIARQTARRVQQAVQLVRRLGR
ncbi:hypothetical protein [Paracoccus salsus]|uniref:hypothetical protein n=1 Tax=Paracoccus salsus TaxID=2911061 RepID=UPI001F4553B5|nr:hypothetical protein [Paracoccus salsus]MCF3973753.1 hypothetical protein [Paracoccus salsus]